MGTIYKNGIKYGGGSGLPEPRAKDKLLLSTENTETSELEWSQVDKYKAVEIPLYETKAAAEADIANLSDGQIIATKDEGNENAKPVDVVESGNMHAVTSNAVAKSLSYSTEEVKTGGTWIDGKPIYRKVIDCGALPSITSKNVVTGLDFTVCNVVKMEGFAKNVRTSDSTDIINIPYSNEVLLSTTKTGHLSVYASKDFSNFSQSYVTLEYTKTTD